MLSEFKELLSNDASLEDESNTSFSNEVDELRCIVLSLLLAAGDADDEFSSEELGTIIELANKKLGYDSTSIRAFLENKEYVQVLPAEFEELCREFDAPKRIQILSLVWSVLGADSVVPRKESAFADTIRKRLQLTIEQAVLARKYAEGVEIDGFKEFVENSPKVIAVTAGFKTAEE